MTLQQHICVLLILSLETYVSLSPMFRNEMGGQVYGD
jgi:hypothetical protein